jgi:hypothetical protein
MKQIFCLVSLFLAAITLSQAATFQYIFNNIEQGEGGTASPSIQVNGSEVKKNGVVTTASDPAPTPSAPSAANANTMTTEMAEMVLAETPKHRFRVIGSGTRMSYSTGKGFGNITRDVERLGRSDSSLSAALALTYWTSPDIGFTAFWWAPTGRTENVFGGEMEFVPVRVAVLGKTDFIEAGLLGGASQMGKKELRKFGTFHVGGRLSVNFHRHLGITSSVRTNLTDRATYQYTQADLGLAYRF